MASSRSAAAPAEQRDLIIGRTETGWSDNSICTSKYTLLTVFPLAIGGQFRKHGNVYFLVIGSIMALGKFGGVFDSAVSPFTTLLPLAIVIAISFAQEVAADLKRHRSDRVTNTSLCVVLKNTSPTEGESPQPGIVRNEEIFSGKDLQVGDAHIACANVARMDIRAGDLILVRNREMIPADIILLASNSENGSAYVETSPIDGETNLKLRTRPSAPEETLLTNLTASIAIPSNSNRNNSSSGAETETLEQAVKRITRYSYLRSNDINTMTPASRNPHNTDTQATSSSEQQTESSNNNNNRRLSLMFQRTRSQPNVSTMRIPSQVPTQQYVATLTSEAPNASVNTFSGKLTLPPPPTTHNLPSIVIPLDADNILLRGSILRNTGWVLGVACFTGKETKLVMNSFATPSKFSQLDYLMNRTIICILFLMAICVLTMGVLAVDTQNKHFDELWYVGYSKDTTRKWPNLSSFVAPKWDSEQPDYYKWVLMYITLVSNFVPLSLYVTVEIVTVFMMYLINVDIDMYHTKTDTAAAARNTNITDLGQVEYVFSDKTGTLTQNVMVFKRCTVDGHMYGKPVQKSAPTAAATDGDESGVDLFISNDYKPLPHLLSSSTTTIPDDLPQSQEPISSSSNNNKKMTFNAEMFLRVMSICHTVVVEKEFTGKIKEDDDDDTKSTTWSIFSPKNKKKKKNKSPNSSNSNDDDDTTVATERNELRNDSNLDLGQSVDGAPKGFTYQAESPDEGALVSGASLEYHFQLLGRDSNGVKLSCSSPSIFEDNDVVTGLKTGALNMKQLAARTSLESQEGTTTTTDNKIRHETWAILAINKFDSTRKRMSVLVRSPPELGSLPILFCKGADSSMLDSDICQGSQSILSEDEKEICLNKVIEEAESVEVVDKNNADTPDIPGNIMTSTDNEDEYGHSVMLGIQSHLGSFASEGLRTLVLGLRILTEKECEDWLAQHKLAASSINDRDRLLTAAASDIECKMHIVGATAIEDKLQKGVPETIQKLEQSGIKLWVLTGDKRETAIEIGYSTRVLTPKMHVTEVADGPAERVKTLLAMEFIRLIKMGKLKKYQNATLQSHSNASAISDCLKATTNFLTAMSRGFWRFYYKNIFTCCGKVNTNSSNKYLTQMDAEDIIMDRRKDPIARHKKVRNEAYTIIQAWKNTPEGKDEHEKHLLKKKRGSGPHFEKKLSSEYDEMSDDEDISLTSDSVPHVFMRAISANILMGDLNQSKIPNKSGGTSVMNMKQLSVIDEDALSMESFRPEGGELTNNFNKKKNHFLERMFAVDRDVRNGRLIKHLTIDKRDDLLQQSMEDQNNNVSATKDQTDVRRALVIEGSALLHLLGNDLLEEVFFAVASQCDSVIACRVSPKQKALIVKLVRNYVEPTPVTLAIGDGANDVGMIQEAHIGIGISGLEGQQAVNASDFSIAQFRFLEVLLLVHGRWNFSRMSRVILYSFYKNAVLATLLLLYSSKNLFSTTSLFDQWVMSSLNFIAMFPILFLGIFDRDLSKNYVKRNPESYAPGPNNEYITNRTILRWVLLVFIHSAVIFYGCLPCITMSGGMTSAFKGLMKGAHIDNPGDGEGGDIKVVGTLIFSVMIMVLAFKVLFECRSLIHGKFPSCTCRKDVGEGIFNRLAYTWHAVIYGSFIFLLFFLYVYQYLGQTFEAFKPYVMVTSHMFDKRSISWMLMLLIPIVACAIDVGIKVFSNMFYPTQIQIHSEIQASEIGVVRSSRRSARKN